MFCDGISAAVPSVEADAPPAIAKDTPASPSAGTAFRRRLRLESGFVFAIEASLRYAQTILPVCRRFAIRRASSRLRPGDATISGIRLFDWLHREARRGFDRQAYETQYGRWDISCLSRTVSPSDAAGRLRPASPTSWRLQRGAASSPVGSWRRCNAQESIRDLLRDIFSSARYH